MCSSQRSQACELATTTERFQVGGGYTVPIKKLFTLNKLVKMLDCQVERVVVMIHLSQDLPVCVHVHCTSKKKKRNLSSTYSL